MSPPPPPGHRWLTVDPPPPPFPPFLRTPKSSRTRLGVEQPPPPQPTIGKYRTKGEKNPHHRPSL